MRLLVFVPVMLLVVVATDLAGIMRYRPSGDLCPAGTMLVMGAAQYDGTPSPAFRRRLDAAFDLYQVGCAELIVVSGGRREGDRFSEGEAGVSYLAGRGVPWEALAVEATARNSYENLAHSRELVEGRLLIVTDDLHAYRSQWLANHLGYDDVNVATVRAGGARTAYALRELASLLGYQLGLTH